MGIIEARTEWWTDHSNLCALFRWLDDRGEMDDVAYFLEKPWKWTPEWNEMHGVEPANDVEVQP